MIRPLETDGVPAPSPFDPVHRMRRRPKLSFNGYTYYRARVSRPINADRERWYEWLGINELGYDHKNHIGGRFTVPQWDQWWDAFIAEQDDDQDLHDTQDDVINSGTP